MDDATANRIIYKQTNGNFTICAPAATGFKIEAAPTDSFAALFLLGRTLYSSYANSGERKE